MILQITPQMTILVAVESADFRRGIDGLARLCREALEQDPLAGTVFVFCNRKRTVLRVLMCDGQGFWLCHKRLPQGRFAWWPGGEGRQQLAAHQLAVLFSAGNPTGVAGRARLAIGRSARLIAFATIALVDKWRACSIDIPWRF